MAVVRFPWVKVRTLDGWLDTSTGHDNPNPDDDPGGWAEAFATRDIDGDITEWYQANTGHNPALSYESISGNLTITDSWLNANLGNGRVSFSDGRWLVERYRATGSIVVNADNVTLRNFHVDSTGALYGLRSTTNCVGLVAEYGTIDGNGANDNGASVNFSEATDPNQITLRFLDLSGFRAGVYAFGGLTAEYCYSHDLHYSSGSHNTGASIRSRNVTLRRNLITDGNSAAISLYPEYTPYTGILVQENALRLPESDTGPEVILAAKQYWQPQPGETRRLVGNLFYRGGNLGGGGIGGERGGFTEIFGNVDRNGGVVS